MSSINLYGIVIALSLILLILGFSGFRNFLLSIGSLRSTERLHSALHLSGGIVIGVSIGSYATEELFNEKFAFGFNEVVMIGLVLLGISLIIIGKSFLQDQLWSPLEQMSEYSAEFGVDFVGTKLPLLGGKELQMFSKRFNRNITKLANKISETEIQMKLMKGGVDRFIDAGSELSAETFNLESFIDKYSLITNKQNLILTGLEEEINQFIELYDQSQEKLNDRFIEIRGLSEVGNLISINASIESSNLDIPNPGFETIAAKLHELAESLDENQDSLRVLLLDISKHYNSFNQSLTSTISETLKISREITDLGSKVEQVMQRVKINETGFMTSSKDLKSTMGSISSNLPDSY